MIDPHLFPDEVIEQAPELTADDLERFHTAYTHVLMSMRMQCQKAIDDGQGNQTAYCIVRSMDVVRILQGSSMLLELMDYYHGRYLADHNHRGN